MRRRLALWELGGFLFTAALGTVLHFTYGWSGGNLLAAAFSALLLFESVLLSGASTFDVLAVRAISFASLFSGMCSPSRCKLFLPVGSGNDLFSII